jgi:hypothetical protein
MAKVKPPLPLPAGPDGYIVLTPSFFKLCLIIHLIQENRIYYIFCYNLFYY